MGKIKEALFSVSKEEFEAQIWPELEIELRVVMEEEAAPPPGGGPGGGLSMNFDSLTAVTVIVAVIPHHLDKEVPAEKVIREGGYASIDDFITDIKPKFLKLCSDLKKDKVEEQGTT